VLPIEHPGLRPLWARSLPGVGPWVRLLGGDHQREAVYHQLVMAWLRSRGSELLPLPVKGAASSSLLYLLLRLAELDGIVNVLELGVGESTRLLDDVRRRERPDLMITSLEHDPGWAALIGDQTGRHIPATPLVRRSVRGMETQAYDRSCLSDQRFDLIIVDGPPGVRRHSRWGALELLQHHLADQFVLVIDDAGRRGELDTVAGALEVLADMGLDVSVGLTVSSTSQVVIASPQFRHVCHL
jgi:hypothetical protein